MFSYKSIIISIITLLLVQNIHAANNSSNVILTSVIRVMQQCYEEKHKTGAQLAQCMAEVFNKAPNPEHYEIKLTGDVPGDVSLLLYNQAGYRINCAISAQKTILVKYCTSYQSAPLTEGQEMSIIPPN
ncbi:Uncharacterised protein [Legionella lansingensis]|uniref:Uncharacterized protein n=1 Tax=Legionella lansingensis TaxID=45067 RepID=A0A0W0VHK7_9GAMM|nr:hypothetical protein [Legionella lansingensis]KTD19604.1 hypothetical protein Llan_2066 [Legionella lansingensis]SNV50200.1 Uncharacterised protein [Legionella lansingensis]